MPRIWQLLPTLVLAGCWFAGPLASPALAQTSTTAGERSGSPSALPWLQRPASKQERSGPPLPSRKPAKPVETASTPAAEAPKPSAVPVNPELVHAGLSSESEPAERVSAAKPPAAAPMPVETAQEAKTPEPQTAAVDLPTAKPVDAPPPARKPLPASELRPVATPASVAPAPDRKPASMTASEPPTPDARPEGTRAAQAEPDTAPKPPAAERPTPRKVMASLAPLPSRKPAQQARAPEPQIGTPAPESAAPQENESTADLQQTAQNKSRKQLCLALRGCRVTYTRCFNRLEKEVKPELWSAERTKCVNTYKACINKHFKSGEMFFTRWFTPYENCD